jgi:hypothetical protein
MKRRGRVWLSLAVAVAGALSLAGGADARKPMPRWRDGDAHAPGTFWPWRGAPKIALPVSRTAFERYLKRMGASWVEDGDLPGKAATYPYRSLDKVPAPYKGAVEFEWESKTAPDGQLPHFIAYVDKDDRVVFVEKNFEGEVN